jgi:hypothetical protein
MNDLDECGRKEVYALRAGFVKQGTADNMNESVSEEGEEEDGDGRMGRFDWKGITAQKSSSEGLGWNSPGAKPHDDPNLSMNLGTPLDRGFVPSSSKQPVLNVNLSAEKSAGPTVVRPSLVHQHHQSATLAVVKLHLDSPCQPKFVCRENDG